MALFRNYGLECRHLTLNDTRTSIALERSFWLAAEWQAVASGMDWREWATAQLKRRPSTIGRGRWLRVSILEGAKQ